MLFVIHEFPSAAHFAEFGPMQCKSGAFTMGHAEMRHSCLELAKVSFLKHGAGWVFGILG